jgi:hypothetical protein
MFAMYKPEGYTVRVFGGYNSVKMSGHPSSKVKISNGEILGGAIGYRFSPTVRIEGEIAYRQNEVHSMRLHGKTKNLIVPLKGDIISVSYIGHMMFEPNLFWLFRPYFGAGLGAVCENGDWQVVVIEDSLWIDIVPYERTAFAYQLTGGLRLPVGQWNTYCGIEVKLLDALLDHMCHCNKSVAFSWHKVF